MTCKPESRILPHGITNIIWTSGRNYTLKSEMYVPFIQNADEMRDFLNIELLCIQSHVLVYCISLLYAAYKSMKVNKFHRQCLWLQQTIRAKAGVYTQYWTFIIAKLFSWLQATVNGQYMYDLKGAYWVKSALFNKLHIWLVNDALHYNFDHPQLYTYVRNIIKHTGCTYIYLLSG